MVYTEESKNVLIICRSYGIDAPQPIRFRNLAPILAEGFNLHLIRFEDETTQPLNDKHLYKTVTGVSYNRISKILFRKSSSHSQEKSLISPGRKMSFRKFVKRAFSLLFFPDNFIIEYRRLVHVTTHIIREQKIDTVIASAQPFTVLKLSRPIKRITGNVKFIFDTGDPLFDNADNKQRPIYNYLARLYERKYFRYTDKIVVPTLAMAKMYRINYSDSVVGDKLEIIPQGFADPGIEGSSQVFNNTDELRLVYAGRFYLGLRDPEKFFKVLEKHTGIKLDLFGRITQNFIPSNNNVKYRGSVSSDAIAGVYKGYDAIVFLDNNSGYQIPGKLFEVISIRKPVIFIYDNPDSPALEIIKEYPAAILVKNEISELDNTLADLAEKLGQINSFEYPIDKYSWTSLGKSYAQIISRT